MGSSSLILSSRRLFAAPSLLSLSRRGWKRPRLSENQATGGRRQIEIVWTADWKIMQIYLNICQNYSLRRWLLGGRKHGINARGNCGVVVVVFFNNYWMRLSMIWRLMQSRSGCYPLVQQTQACIAFHKCVWQKPNPMIISVIIYSKSVS